PISSAITAKLSKNIGRAYLFILWYSSFFFGYARISPSLSKNGDCSSVGTAPDCDSGRRGFESHQSPQIFKPLGHAKRLFLSCSQGNAAIRSNLPCQLPQFMPKC